MLGFEALALLVCVGVGASRKGERLHELLQRHHALRIRALKPVHEIMPEKTFVAQLVVVDVQLEVVILDVRSCKRYCFSYLCRPERRAVLIIAMGPHQPAPRRLSSARQS